MLDTSKDKIIEENILKMLVLLDQEDSLFKDIISELVKIYDGEYRHCYNKFFKIINKVSSDNDRDNDALDSLTENLQILMNKADQLLASGDERRCGLMGIIKLCDHFLIEIGRCQNLLEKERDVKEFQKNLVNIKKEMAAMVEKNNEYKDKVDDYKKTMSEADKQIKGLKLEIVTVLGIFAAIIMSVSGGFGFLSNTITALAQNVNVFKLAFLAIICGVIVFDIIYALIFFITYLTKNEKIGVKIFCWVNIIAAVFILLLGIAFMLWPQFFEILK